MKRLLCFLGFWVTLSILLASPLTVATSIYPLYDMLRQIGQEPIEPLLLVPPAANPHTFEPTPETIMNLQEASIFIGIDPHFDGWVQKFLPPQTTAHFLAHELEEHHHHDNPHIWLSILNAQKMATAITRILGEQLPKYAVYFQENNTAYQQELQLVHQEITDLLAPLPMRKFIQWHPAWNDFAADYQLEIVGTIEHGHGHEPSVKEFMELIQTARDQNVQVVVLGLHLQNKNVDALVREIAGKLARLDTIGSPDRPEANTYIQMMRHNAQTLAQALQGSN